MRLLLHTPTHPFCQMCLDTWPDRFGVLLTPASGYRVDRWPGHFLAADNGCYQRPADDKFVGFARHFSTRAAWVVLPDVVGDAVASREMSLMWRERLEGEGIKANWAWVLQDGFDIEQLPEGINCLFLGGTTEYKLSREARDTLIWGREQGYYIHVGRVNTERRIKRFEAIADSADGTNFARWVTNPTTRRIMRRHAEQMRLI